MIQATLLEVKAGKGLVLKNTACISHSELTLLTGSISLSAFLTLDGNLHRKEEVRQCLGSLLEYSYMGTKTNNKKITLFQKMGEQGYGSW